MKYLNNKIRYIFDDQILPGIKYEINNIFHNIPIFNECAQFLLEDIKNILLYKMYTNTGNINFEKFQLQV